ncbi:MAG: GNAT family protein [Bacteriovorax sp.]|nr:GNAT family protein [Bacteriovorax sp.]
MNLIVDNEITIRISSAEYAEELFSLVQNNLGNKLCYWCPDIENMYSSRESTLAIITKANSKFQEDGTPDFLIFFNNSLAGLISLGPLNINENKCEIGYWLGLEFENFGLITRSFPAILNYARVTLGLATVELSTAITNIKSQKIPRKFYFIQDQILTDAEILDDGPVDHIIWRLDF